MKRLRNIFEKDNFTFIECSTKKITKKTERIKVEVLNPDEVLIDFNTGGKDAPLYIEALLKLSQKETGEVYFVIEALDQKALSSLLITTDFNDIGKNLTLYSSKQLAILYLKDDNYVSFKFTPYCKHNQIEKIKIRCM